MTGTSSYNVEASGMRTTFLVVTLFSVLDGIFTKAQGRYESMEEAFFCSKREGHGPSQRSAMEISF